MTLGKSLMDLDKSKTAKGGASSSSAVLNRNKKRQAETNVGVGAWGQCSQGVEVGSSSTSGGNPVVVEDREQEIRSIFGGECPLQLAKQCCKSKRYEHAMVFAERALQKGIRSSEFTQKVLQIYLLPRVTTFGERNYYEVFQVPKSASVNEILNAYGVVRFLVHPLQNPGMTISHEALKIVNTARDTLLVSRDQYNSRLTALPPPPPTTHGFFQTHQNNNFQQQPLFVPATPSPSDSSSSSSSEEDNPPIPSRAYYSKTTH